MSHKGSQPDWLYESLPFLYLAAGMLTMFVLGNAIGVFSGLMLVSAGLFVGVLRLKYRRSQRELAALRALVPKYDETPPAPGLVRLAWRPEYECGNTLIDIQHRRLFESGNNLLNAILEDRAKLDVELMLDDMIAHVESHFCDEEALLARSQHPISKAHQELHQQLLARAKKLASLYHQGELAAGDLFTFVANDLVAQHIVREDLKFLLSPQDGQP